MKLSINYNKPVKPIGLMNAVNNGPVYVRTNDQNAGNMDLYKAANIPFARTHDASFFSRYGGEHTVDVHMIFPDFNADPEDPASYDFHLTDEYMDTIKLAGTEVYYRLGSKIEHESKKYGTLPPPDFKKWAVICEHIIAHMNEGWADGHHFGIKYWEIWNEPDGCPDDAPYNDHKTWGGTKQEFFELYEITAKHLKSRFPDLKIGGPALCGVHCWFDPDYARSFIAYMSEHSVPIDFFSWHGYGSKIESYGEWCRDARALLDEFGYTETESHLNEWNYVKSFIGEGWPESLRIEASIKGAAFIAGVMSACQDEPLDMLMYYDARPCGMNGMFDSPLYNALKGYYPIKTWGELRTLGTQCEASCDIPDVYVTAAANENDNLAMITYYTDDDNAKNRTFTVEVDIDRMYTVYLLDEKHDLEDVAEIFPCDGRFQLTMEPNTVIVLK